MCNIYTRITSIAMQLRETVINYTYINSKTRFERINQDVKINLLNIYHSTLIERFCLELRPQS